MLTGILASAIGIWLMAAPDTLDYGDPAASSHHIIGPLVVSFAVIAIWETTRQVRRLNLALVLVLVIESLVLDIPVEGVISTIVSAVGIAALTLVPSPVEGRYGGGWREVLDWRRPESG